jgi:hypothetical protein
MIGVAAYSQIGHAFTGRVAERLRWSRVPTIMPGTKRTPVLRLTKTMNATCYADSRFFGQSPTELILTPPHCRDKGDKISSLDSAG